ncbi:BON domain protein [Pseudobythopirellula maris]|uniref:BON domain protein n=1 Tax=Pseudobythopirellula maris TaxID=2527991 RepID=A0A5C5ZRG8_9BACT|nr:BON domain-containing protein [Pseudobythopirellula maris]TWT89648.1 BON domain protein [Pseudobythopirellula maris]
MIVTSNAAAPVGPLADLVHNALETSPYLPSRSVRVEEGEGRVRLHGAVRSYFEKQMAQEIVVRLDGVERVENLIQVNWG